MLNHLHSHNILITVDKEHGFRSRHSCESQHIITIHNLLTSVDRERHVDIVFFQNIQHSIPSSADVVT